MSRLNTLDRDISPPPLRKTSASAKTHSDRQEHEDEANASLAAIEAGEVEIRDHLAHFVKHLSAVLRPDSGPRVSFDEFEQLYKRNEHRHGHHFVVHQHDHPISGVHYDLRLQFSDTSSISFAVPYGLPGNPNSQRPNRMAIETRVHNVWNHLIESASHATGSLLIWDTGEYEVLPRSEQKQDPVTDDETSDHDATRPDDDTSQSEKLFAAFQARHIRLRLHGVKLPRNYTVSLRLPSANDKSTQPRKPKHKRRRTDPAKTSKAKATSTDSDTDSAPTALSSEREETPAVDDMSAALASEDDEDMTIRQNNAYTGSSNTIGSIHQRHWFLTLDRRSSGFRKARSGTEADRWVGDWDAFFLYGRDHERSVVTGRTADDVMSDEGVEKFIGRKMWRPITE